MVESSDFLDFCMEEIPVSEREAIPIGCWQKVSLPDIWIPSHLLPNRSQSKNIQAAQGIFHTLEKKDPSKYIESFSVYLDNNTEEEIFFSDSDDDIFDLPKLEEIPTLPSNALPATSNMIPPFRNILSNDDDDSIENGNVNNLKRKNDMNPSDNLTFANLTNSSVGTRTNQNEGKSMNVLNSAGNLMNNERCKDMINNQNNDVTKSLSSLAIVNDFHAVKTKNFEGGDRQPLRIEDQDTDSLISLNEILNITPDVDMMDFTFNFKEKKDSALFSTHKEPKSKKNKKEKKVKKKSTKQITLDMLFEDPGTTQEFYCDKYFKNLIDTRDRNSQINEESLKREEYPYFEPEENFVYYKTTKGDNAAFSSNYLNKPENISRTAIKENVEISTGCSNVTEERKNESTTVEKKSAKIVIENIPYGASQEDISTILEGLGEIKQFSVIHTGMFLTVFIEIDLINCDIDWVIECIDGSEPFGASCDVLRCYKQE